MAERLAEWPLPAPAAWETGAQTQPETVRAEAIRCGCGMPKEASAARCRRCALAQAAETRERARMLLAPPSSHKPAKVARMLGVSLSTVYRARNG